MAPETPPIFRAVATSTRPLYQLLRCINFAPRVHVQITEEGIRFAADHARVMQGTNLYVEAIGPMLTFNQALPSLTRLSFQRIPSTFHRPKMASLLNSPTSKYLWRHFSKFFKSLGPSTLPLGHKRPTRTLIEATCATTGPMPLATRPWVSQGPARCSIPRKETRSKSPSKNLGSKPRLD